MYLHEQTYICNCIRKALGLIYQTGYECRSIYTCNVIFMKTLFIRKSLLQNLLSLCNK